MKKGTNRTFREIELFITKKNKISYNSAQEKKSVLFQINPFKLINDLLFSISIKFKEEV